MLAFRSALAFSMLLAAGSALGCESELSDSLDGHPCDADGQCLSGYACDATSQLCVLAAAESAEPDNEQPACNAECAGVCVDLTHDARNCGACGRVCADQPGGVGVCKAGACSVTCSAPFTMCNGACVDTSRDSRNCGACAAPCADDKVCQDGNCANACAAGQLDCGFGCVDAQTDPKNCGDCKNVCRVSDNGTSSCVGGACKLACDQGFTACDGACVSLDSDPKNCGSCGKACPGKQNCVLRLCL
jgi:hypothetical protein